MATPILASDILKRYRVTTGSGFKLDRFDPADCCELDIEKAEAKELLADGREAARQIAGAALCRASMVDPRRLQGLDAAGKDGVIKHVMSGVNPQGCEVHSFKVPSQIELDHDFLWRSDIALPRRGHIGIFNRSYYEEVLVVRVHKELLDKQNLPPSLSPRTSGTSATKTSTPSNVICCETAPCRSKSACTFPRKSNRSGCSIASTIQTSSRSSIAGDVERTPTLGRIDQQAYDEMIRGTATEEAPWHVVPADNKWFTRLVVAAAIVERIEAIDPRFPTLDESQMRQLASVRAGLIAD